MREARRRVQERAGRNTEKALSESAETEAATVVNQNAAVDGGPSDGIEEAVAKEASDDRGSDSSKTLSDTAELRDAFASLSFAEEERNGKVDAEVQASEVPRDEDENKTPEDADVREDQEAEEEL